MNHSINPRRVKIHRTATLEEAARLFGARKNTVRCWLKQGLPAIDRNRSILIHGREFAAFLDARRKQLKRTCGPGRVYCVKCRESKEPADGMAGYMPLSPTSGYLRGICPECHILIHRRGSLAKLNQVRGSLRVMLPHAHRHIESHASRTSVPSPQARWEVRP